MLLQSAVLVSLLCSLLLQLALQHEIVLCYCSLFGLQRAILAYHYKYFNKYQWYFTVVLFNTTMQWQIVGVLLMNGTLWCFLIQNQNI